MSEDILRKIEKKLCQAFKDVLESRENSRKYLNTFAVKQNARPIRNKQLLEDYKGQNSSYKILEHNLSTGQRHSMLSSLVMGASANVHSQRNIVDQQPLNSKTLENPLINKEFYCIQFGQESALATNTTHPTNIRTSQGNTRVEGVHFNEKTKRQSWPI